MAILSQKDVMDRSDIPAWYKQVVADLEKVLKPPTAFPCTFAPNAFRRRLIDFSFITPESPHESAYRDISEYVDTARTWSGDVNAARPLVMAFSHELAAYPTLQGYHDFGWQMLQGLHALDSAPWPEGVARDPTEKFWSFCAAGMQLFVNMSAPAHIHRRSRNLGRHFLFIVNPRERFDIVAGETEEGRRIRNVIRQRAEAYDGQPHAPQLGKFLNGELEWPQYALPDRNEEGIGDCPFQQKVV